MIYILIILDLIFVNVLICLARLYVSHEYLVSYAEYSRNTSPKQREPTIHWF